MTITDANTNYRIKNTEPHLVLECVLIRICPAVLRSTGGDGSISQISDRRRVLVTYCCLMSLPLVSTVQESSHDLTGPSA